MALVTVACGNPDKTAAVLGNWGVTVSEYSTFNFELGTPPPDEKQQENGRLSNVEVRLD